MDCPYFMDSWDGSPNMCRLGGECLGYCDIAAELDDDSDYLYEEEE